MKKSEAIKLRNKMDAFFAKAQEVKMSKKTVKVGQFRISTDIQNAGAAAVVRIQNIIRQESVDNATIFDLRPSQARDLETWSLAAMAKDMSKHSRYLITGFMHGHYSEKLCDKVLMEIAKDLENHISVCHPKYGSMDGYWEDEFTTAERIRESAEQIKKARKERYWEKEVRKGNITDNSFKNVQSFTDRYEEVREKAGNTKDKDDDCSEPIIFE